MNIFINLKSIIYIIFIFLTLIVSSKYSGNLFIFYIFSLLSIFLIDYSFRKDFISMKLISLLLFLGLWFRLSFTTFFLDSKFTHQPYLDISNKNFDDVLLVSSIGILSILIVIFLFSKIKKIKSTSVRFYKKKFINTYLLYSIFFLLSIFFCYYNLDNFYYVRGFEAKTNIFFPGDYLFSWLIQFGFLSLFIYFFENNIKDNKVPTSFGFIVLIFISSILSYGILSRASIVLNLFLLALYINKSKFNFLSLRSLKLFLITLLFSTVSIVSSDIKRDSIYASKYKVFLKESTTSVTTTTTIESPELFDIIKLEIESTNKFIHKAFGLFITRWVGVDGIISVVNYPYKSTSLFYSSLNEKRVKYAPSFFDKVFVPTIYENANREFINPNSIPGPIAFFYYSGNFFILFCGIFILSSLSIILEILIFRSLSNYYILPSFFIFLIAWRYIHFGNYPLDSYKILIAILFNLFLIKIIDNYLTTNEKLS